MNDCADDGAYAFRLGPRAGLAARPGRAVRSREAAAGTVRLQGAAALRAAFNTAAGPRTVPIRGK